MATTQRGYLVLADIAGYTSYLAGVELSHAHEILADLLEIICHKIETLLAISKLEGDAVFAYGLDAALARGETLLELIEVAYAAFCDRRESAFRHTTCACAACRAIPSLDLKFFVHYGDFIIQDISATRELIGSDVNLVHRLMKNRVTEATGWKAYALFTVPALERLGVQPEDLHSQVQSYEHLGDVQTSSFDLKTRYQEMAAARRVFVSAREADYVVLQDFPAAPPLVWEWLTDARLRNIWLAREGAMWTDGVRPKGRTGPGARNHCAHGQGESVETILDWRPFDYASFETRHDGPPMRETIQLEPLPDGQGTRVHDHIVVEMPLPTPLRRLLVQLTMRRMKYAQLIAAAARLLAEEMARREHKARSQSQER